MMTVFITYIYGSTEIVSNSKKKVVIGVPELVLDHVRCLFF